jgi:hypothetical protein
MNTDRPNKSSGANEVERQDRGQRRSELLPLGLLRVVASRLRGRLWSQLVREQVVKLKLTPIENGGETHTRQSRDPAV